jgi:hypothetical protein
MIEPRAHIALEAAYRTEARRVRATLIRLCLLKTPKSAVR